MGHSIVSKLAMLGDLCSRSLSTGCGAYSFVCIYVCMFLFFLFYVIMLF